MIKYTNNTSMIVKYNVMDYYDRKLQYDDRAHKPVKLNTDSIYKLAKAKRFLRSIGR